MFFEVMAGSPDAVRTPLILWACGTVSRRLAHGFEALAETMRENRNV
jgi:hypothetical protein